MAPQTHRPRKSVEDFMAPPGGTLAELIEGEILVSPAPRLDHQQVLKRPFRRLDAHVEERGLGTIALSPMDVHLPSGDVVQPDLTFVARENASSLRDWVRGVPDLLIEIGSSTRPERDRVVKRALYERVGVPAYWLVDLRGRAVEVLCLEDGAYVPRGYFQPGTALVSSSFPGLCIPIDDLFV